MNGNQTSSSLHEVLPVEPTSTHKNVKLPQNWDANNMNEYNFLV